MKRLLVVIGALTFVATARAALGPRVGETPTYHVSKTHCSDSGPGTAALPFCSIQLGASRLRAGETLLIADGTYRELVHVESSGAPGAPIVIRGESRGGVILDGGCRRFPCREAAFRRRVRRGGQYTDAVVVRNRDYVTLQDLTVRGALENGVNADTTTGVTVQNVSVRRTGRSSINVYDSHQLVLRGNSVSRSNLGMGTRRSFHNEEESVTIVNTSDFDVAFNRLQDSVKEGIVAKVGSRDGAIHDNVVRRICAVGIYLDEADRVRVNDNRVSRTGFYKLGKRTMPCSSLPTYGRDMGRYFGNGLLVAVGDLGDLSTGKLSDIRIYRNVVSGARLNCLEFWDELAQSGQGGGAMTGNQVFNNVFYGCGREGIGAGIRLDYASGTLVANNIIARNEEAGITGNAIGDSSVSHNLFYKTGQSAGTANVLSDPLFVNPGRQDFRLREKSPAIDSGTDLGLPFTGAGPDLGAYETSPGG